MKNKNYKIISLSKLIVNPNNDRFEPVTSEKEAIENIIVSSGSKLLYLAKHILNNGLSPKPFYVIPHGNGYLIKDGNRRATSIKLMNKPNLIDKKKFGAIRTRFDKLSKQFKKNPINSVYCYVYDDDESADNWVKLEHTGEQNGIGVVQWGSEPIQRFNAKRGKTKSRELQALDFIKKSSYIDDSIKKKTELIKLTNLQRLLGDSDVCQAIGIIYNDQILSSELHESEIAKVLSKIIEVINDDDFKVKNIYTKKERARFIENIKDFLPNPQNKADSFWDLDPSEDNGITLENVPGNENSLVQKKQEKMPVTRKTLIPSSCIMSINNPKVNKIYHELQNMDPHRFVNCSAVALRVFIELSVDTYIEKYGLTDSITSARSGKALFIKIKLVSNRLRQKGFIDVNVSKGITTMTNDNDSIFGIDSLHHYIHNNVLSPLPENIITTWDNIQEFMVSLWYNIEKE